MTKKRTYCHCEESRQVGTTKQSQPAKSNQLPKNNLVNKINVEYNMTLNCNRFSNAQVINYDKSMFDYAGRWINEEGNELIIRHFLKDRYIVRYIRRDGRLLFANKWKLFLFMFPFGRLGKVINEILTLNLEGPIGPTLSFKQLVDDKNRELLIIEIGPSLYDGYEDIMGIPCFIPLSPFRRKV